MNAQCNDHRHAGIVPLIDAIESYAGCDPDFDNGLDELERQFAEYRLTLAND